MPDYQMEEGRNVGDYSSKARDNLHDDIVRQDTLPLPTYVWKTTKEVSQTI